MDTYLNKYKGKYRVYAHYDLQTNDFIRDYDGNLEDSFGDFYLRGRSGIEVKHGTGSTLACYIPSLQIGNNVLKSYYETTIGNPKGKSMNKIVGDLKNSGYVEDVDILSVEVFFTFHADHLDALAPIIKLRTSGANISPFSTKNLPRAPYTIPDKDMELYKKCRGDLTGLEINKVQNEFIAKKFDDNFKIDLRKEMLKPLQYFHKVGYFSEYCEYLRGRANEN